ncbi:hypothetical protein [Corynebacterium crudilactis]|uniref:Uncharacterized protein n=1 Tax=Corynebacterium crudilactis TaxID=1652495 RepID=A0A172QXZ8_9CORY|nr:hypothetical protein [Corynebacterium crudilactis]ANE05520.1 hypothetical protein ccrud_14360 [Corynebacterium crudilactis]
MNNIFGSTPPLDFSMQALMLLVAVLALLVDVAGPTSPTHQAEPQVIIVLEQAEPAPTVPVEPAFVQV